MTNELTTTTDRTEASAPVYSPRTDILEREDRLELRVDVPGVPRDAIEVKAEKGTLAIHAERVVDDGGLIHREFGAARFRRAFTLPEGYDADAIRARLENGVLEISIPKAAHARPRKIEVG